MTASIIVPPTDGLVPTPRRKSQGRRVIQWIEANCIHTNGEWRGKPFRCLPWEKQLLMELFEVEWHEARQRYLRRYRWALIGLPKKNGKTELVAALDLYFLIGDGEPAPLVTCAAASEEQADLIYGAARVMCEESPTLRLLTECYEKEILVPSIPGAKLLRVAAAAGTNDGKNIFVSSCDELHEWILKKHRDTWTVLTNGMGARLQPMVLQIRHGRLRRRGDGLRGTISVWEGGAAGGDRRSALLFSLGGSPRRLRSSGPRSMEGRQPEL